MVFSPSEVILSTKHIHVQLDGGCGMVNAYGGLSLASRRWLLILWEISAKKVKRHMGRFMLSWVACLGRQDA